MERLTGFNQRNKLSYIEGYAEYLPTKVQMQLIQAVVDKCRQYEDAEAEGRLLVLPCKVGDTVYRICPKCNKSHDGSCDHCAWQGTGGAGGCMVFGMWDDGSYPPDKCTIVPWVATLKRMETVMWKLGTRIFLTREEAEAALRKEGAE